MEGVCICCGGKEDCREHLGYFSLCRACFSRVSEMEEIKEEYLPGFLRGQEDFWKGWWESGIWRAPGDGLGKGTGRWEDFVDWAKKYPGLAREMAEDYRDAARAQWQDYLRRGEP